MCLKRALVLDDPETNASCGLVRDVGSKPDLLTAFGVQRLLDGMSNASKSLTWSSNTFASPAIARCQAALVRKSDES